MCWNELYNELNTISWEIGSSCGCGCSCGSTAAAAPYYVSVPVTRASGCGYGCY